MWMTPLHEEDLLAAFARAARREARGSVIQWPNGFDLCPNVLREWCSTGVAERNRLAQVSILWI
jgi:hypothetical protein